MMLGKETAWAILFTSAVIEGMWALSIKYTEGFTKLVPTLICLGVAGANIALLSLAIKFIPTNIGYTIWVATGIGVATIGSYFLFAEKLSMQQLCFLGLMVVGIVGLKLSSGAS